MSLVDNFYIVAMHLNITKCFLYKMQNFENIPIQHCFQMQMHYQACALKINKIYFIAKYFQISLKMNFEFNLRNRQQKF